MTRRGLLISLLAGSVILLALTELLSLFGGLRPVPLAVAWLAVLAVTAFRVRPAWRLPAWPGVFDAALMAGMAVIAGIVLFIALVSPPNSTDAMAYHMPRVVYWAQAGSVAFFPTPYLNQIMLQPMAEYIVLHTYVLTGGDWLGNMPQVLGFVFSIIGVSLVAKSFGAGRRGQVIAALFCATLPNGILQASGAKNDYLMTAYLVAMVYFAREKSRADGWWAGMALGLALLTKATAYIFAAPLLLALWTPRRWPVMAAAALVLNAPHYVRNIDLTGRPLGYDSAHADGKFRWQNERFGWRETASNLLRHFGDQLGARSEQWNRRVFDEVAAAHRLIGIDPNDPATTWPGNQWQPPRNANHETNANNRWHLLLLALCTPVFAVRWRSRLAWYFAALIAGLLLFCFYLKWPWFVARLLLPLFVLAAPAAGVLLESLAPVWIQIVVCLFLLNNARPYLFENWVRPLKGPRSILRVSREDQYFADITSWNNKPSYLEAVVAVADSGCRLVGIDINRLTLEYPFQVLLRRRIPDVKFVHTGVFNTSKKYEKPSQPCAVLCLDCAGDKVEMEYYRGLGEPRQIGRFLLYLPGQRR